MRPHRRSIDVLACLALSLIAACGSVTPTIDAAPGTIDAPSGTIDAPSGTIDAPSGTIDAPSGTIDAPSGAIDAGVDGPSCVWVAVNMCDTGRTIATFCPTGTHVGDLRRCDGTTFTPDQQYQQFHLCNCTAATCGCNAIGVSWQEVQCCN